MNESKQSEAKPKSQNEAKPKLQRSRSGAVGRQRYPQYKIKSLDQWMDKTLLAADVLPMWTEFQAAAETVPPHRCRDYGVRFICMLKRMKELREQYSPCSKAMARLASERRLGMLKMTRLLRDLKRGAVRVRTKACRPFLAEGGCKAFDATDSKGCPGIWIETQKGNKFLHMGVYLPRRSPT
jgi:hypothetical protein